MEKKDFIINVGPNGTFRPSGSYQSLPEHIDGIFKGYETRQVKKIAVYFHGGLVNEKTGMATAEKMGRHISDAGFAPLCFVWETGLIETVSTNITKISDTELFNKLIKVLVKKLSEKLGFGAVTGRGANAVLTDDQIEMELSKPDPFNTYNQRSFAARSATVMDTMPQEEQDLIPLLEGEFTYMIQADPDFINLISQTRLTVDTPQRGQSRGIISTMEFIKHVALIAFRVIKRFINKRDHNFFPTIVEEILRELYVAELGAWVWNNMKLKSKDMWKDNGNLTGLNRYAGRYLLDKLIEYVKKFPEVQVNLIGHSAGSIAICNLLAETSNAYPGLVYNKIVFMAPACRVELFNAEVVQRKGRFRQFRMFTMNDSFETKDKLVPFLYTHSLLYLISGILEGEGKSFDDYILGLDRHIRGVFPYDTAQELINTKEFLFESGATRIVFSKAEAGALDGFKIQSVSHGGFDDDEDTVQSIKYFLNQA